MNGRKSKELRRLAKWHPKDGKDTQLKLVDNHVQLLATNVPFNYYKSLKKASKQNRNFTKAMKEVQAKQ